MAFEHFPTLKEYLESKDVPIEPVCLLFLASFRSERVPH